jgi:hypothetical protein
LAKFPRDHGHFGVPTSQKPTKKQKLLHTVDEIAPNDNFGNVIFGSHFSLSFLLLLLLLFLLLLLHHMDVLTL